MSSIFYKEKRYGGTIINEGTQNPIWGNISGDITHQNDLINYLSINYLSKNNLVIPVNPSALPTEEGAVWITTD